MNVMRKRKHKQEYAEAAALALPWAALSRLSPRLSHPCYVQQAMTVNLALTKGFLNVSEHFVSL